jgi:hypothetical protein
MSIEVSNVSESAILHPVDAWVIAKALTGHAIEAELPRVSDPSRLLAKRLAESPADGRAKVWEGFTATLTEGEAQAWIDAVAEVSPDDPPPEDDSWGQPLSFELPPVEPFPLDIYPPPVARMVRDVARAIGCAADFPASAVLAVAAASIGRSCSLRLKDGYFASASLYMVCIGSPGDGKSPAVGKIVSPMRRVDERHLTKFREEKQAYESATEVYESAIKCSRRGRAKTDRTGVPNDSGDDQSLEDSEAHDSQVTILPVKPVAPTLRRNVVGDITIEALHAIMANNPRGVIQVLDEASTLTSSMNMYRGGKGSDRQSYMTIWSGQPFTIDRKGHVDNIPIIVPFPALCLLGGTVPDMISSFCDEKGRHDGFIDRISFAYPDPVPKRGWIEEGLSQEVATGWSEVVGRLQGREMRVENLQLSPHVVQLSPQGKRAWRALIDAHHAERCSIEFPRSLCGPWAKLEEYAGRLTLILHMLNIAADPLSDARDIPEVPAGTVEDARRLVTYLKSHSRRVQAAMKAHTRGEEGDDDVQSILNWIYRHQPESFSLRDLNRDLTRTFGKRAKARKDALDWLVKHDCIRLEAPPRAAQRKGGGRRKSPNYLVNPLLYESQNCQNRGSVPSGHPPVDSGDFATGTEDIGRKEVGDVSPPF